MTSPDDDLELPPPRPMKDRTPDTLALAISLIARGREELLLLSHRDPERMDQYIRNVRALDNVLSDLRG